MSHASLVSVNIALPRTLATRPPLVSAIDKVPAHGAVAVGDESLEGDAVADDRRHGGIHQAVHAFAQEDLDWWSQELGRTVRPGFFGENLTTRGIDLNSCLIGEQWAIGTARFQVTSVRLPGETFSRWMALQGVPGPDWQERFVAHGRPGVYLRVLRRGHVYAGDAVEVVDRPAHDLTAEVMFRALALEPELLPLLLEVDGLPPHLYAHAEGYAGEPA